MHTCDIVRFTPFNEINVHALSRLFCAQVKISPFTKGKNQLSKTEVDNSRQLSRVRIHVERVIGVVRQKFTILESTGIKMTNNVIIMNVCSSFSVYGNRDKTIFPWEFL